MSLFKNGVGRPSNEIISRRKKICFIGGLFVVILIFIIILGVRDSFFSKSIEGGSKNSKVSAVIITAKDAKGKKYTGGKWTTKVTMTATLNKKTSGSLRYTWYKDGEKYSGCASKTCTISSTTYSKFTVKIKKGLFTYSSNSLFVQVDAVELNYKLKPDGNVLRLSTNQSPRSGATFVWYMNGKLLKNQKNDVINIVGKEHEFYKVKVTSGVGRTKTYTYENPKAKINATKLYGKSMTKYDGNYTYWDVKLEGSYDGNIKNYYWTKDGKKFSTNKSITMNTQQNSNYCFVIETKNNKKASKCMFVRIDKTVYDMYIIVNGRRYGKLGTGEGISSKFTTIVNIGDVINVSSTKTPSCGSYLTFNLYGDNISLPYKWNKKKKNFYYMFSVKDCAGRTYYTSIGIK